MIEEGHVGTADFARRKYEALIARYIPLHVGTADFQAVNRASSSR